MLALANRVDDQAFMLIGVEDKTKKPLGVKGVTEEQLQQVVSQYCTPPILFSSKLYLWSRGVQIGAIRIRNSHFKPHILKTKYQGIWTLPTARSRRFAKAES